MAMGSPLGPTFANIFMCHLEEKFLAECPSWFKPVYYRRYVDDTFALFHQQEHAQLFLNFINTCHPNIKFTMDLEKDNKISFLDVDLCKTVEGFNTGVFRKPTFTGLGLNFLSYCPLNFKTNSCKTLLCRAYSVCSSWIKFHEEVCFLEKYFSKNGYPSHVFQKMVKIFLDNIFSPKVIEHTVPKKLIYISLPYMGHLSKVIKKELIQLLENNYSYAKFHFIFKNPLTISSLFKFKDSLPELMRSSVIYQFSCPKCNLGNYVGCTNRLLKVRIDSHRGVSYRTGSKLTKPEFSSVRNHCCQCKHKVEYTDFKILGQAQNRSCLFLLESLLIKQLKPLLNNSTSSVPLNIV